jgi:dTDP-4-amino-4,6-dideoxygalactose transaminase
MPISDEPAPLGEDGTHTRLVARQLATRRLALLGGSTSWTDCRAVLSLLATPGLLVAGDAVREYEQRFAAEVGARHAFSFWAGRLALYATLRALRIGSRDEVLVQVPSHVVVPNAIRFAGATPVFVDCDPQTLNMDIARAEALVTSQTRALVVQHTAG